MPMHDYRCRACGGVFEALVRLGGQDTERPACRRCGGADTERLVAAPTAPGKSAGIVAAARQQAAREGHFSHYARSERPRR
jgi:putative FmdB family regulatory protein